MLNGSLQIKGNTYYAVYRVDGKQKWVSTGISIKGNNKRKAEQAMYDILIAAEKEYKAFLKQQKKISKNPLSFTSYLTNWLEAERKLVKPSTWEGYDKVVNGKIIPYFSKKNYLLSELKGAYFTEYFAYLKEHGRSDGTGGLSKKSIINIKGVLSSAFIYALENEMVEYNYIERSRLPHFEENEEEEFEPVVYTKEQLKTLLTYAEQTNSKACLFLYLELITGARKGELLGLTWDTVDFTKNTVTLNKNRTGNRKEILSKLTTPKTKNGYRKFILPQKIMDMLIEEKTLQEYNKKILGNDYITYEYDYIIRQENGRVYHPNSINRIIKKMTCKIGLPHCRIHDYRHAIASLLFEQNIPLQNITKQLGHGQTSTTEKIYIKKNLLVSPTNIDVLSNAIGI